jgi:hypothetical protein
VISIIRIVSAVCLVLALASAAGLLVLDLIHGFKFTSSHQQTSAVALTLIGASYLSVHLVGGLSRGARVKGVLLGAAFCIWGAEQFLGAGALVTAMDCAVVVIFVVDLSLSIVKRLKSRDDSEE